MADQTLDILIRFLGDSAKAREAAAEIDRIKTAQQQSITVTKQATEASKEETKATEKSTLSKGEQKKLVQELAREFPALGIAMKAAMSPQVVLIGSIILLAAKAREAIANWHAEMDAMEADAAKPFFSIQTAIFNAREELKKLKEASLDFYQSQLRDDEAISRILDNRLTKIKAERDAYLELLKAREEMEAAAAKNPQEAEEVRSRFEDARRRVGSRGAATDLNEREVALGVLREEFRKQAKSLASAEDKTASGARLTEIEKLRLQVQNEQQAAPNQIAALQKKIKDGESLLKGDPLGNAAVIYSAAKRDMSVIEFVKEFRAEIEDAKLQLKTVQQQALGEAGNSKAALKLKALNDEQEKYQRQVTLLRETCASLTGQIKTLENAIAKLKIQSGVETERDKRLRDIEAGKLNANMPVGQTPFEKAQTNMTSAGAGAIKILNGGKADPDQLAMIQAIITNFHIAREDVKKVLSMLAEVMKDGIVDQDELKKLQTEFGKLRSRSTVNQYSGI